jgi:futalosine hydrolase
MQILVVSATQLEILPYLSQSRAEDHLITGVGAAASMYHLLKRLGQKKYDLVIQAGIAGSFDTSISLGETVLLQRDIFADLGALENHHFISLFELGLIDKNEWPYVEGWLENEHDFLPKSTLKKVNGITVNTVSDDLKMVDIFAQKYHASVESMEGAAFHYVCLQENIPFLQLRSISNTVGERDKAKWKMQEAIQNLNKELLSIIKDVGF